MGAYISENAQIISVNVEAGTVTNLEAIGFLIFAIGVIGGFFVGIIKR